MLNHSLEGNAKWYFDEVTQSFTVRSIKPIKKGVEIVESYGSRNNAHYLLCYGFTLDDNPNETRQIQLSIDAAINNSKKGAPQLWGQFVHSQTTSAEAMALKTHFLHLNSGEGPASSTNRRFQLCTRPDRAYFKSLLSFVRVAVATLGELSQLVSSLCLDPDPDPENIPSISPRNELATLSAIVEICKSLRSAYEGDLEADEKRLVTELGRLPWNETCALRVTISERQICDHFIHIWENPCLPVGLSLLLGRSLEEYESLIAKQLTILPEGPARDYINSVWVPLLDRSIGRGPGISLVEQVLDRVAS